MDEDIKWGLGGVSVRVRVMFRFRDKEGGKNGGREDCIEGKKGWEGCGGREKNNRGNQTTLPYVNL